MPKGDPGVRPRDVKRSDERPRVTPGGATDHVARSGGNEPCVTPGKSQ